MTPSLTKPAVLAATNADYTNADDHHTIAAAGWSKLTTDTLAADLSASLVDFAARWELVERSWQSILTFQIHCCGSDIVEQLTKAAVRVRGHNTPGPGYDADWHRD